MPVDIIHDFSTQNMP